jgi:hypothetical protein
MSSEEDVMEGAVSDLMGGHGGSSVFKLSMENMDPEPLPFAELLADTVLGAAGGEGVSSG